MKIGIIGTGRMATGLGRRWANAQHQVMFGSRDAARAEALAREIGANASGGTQQAAVDFGDVVVLTTPWNATEETVKALNLDGKVMIETTNNFSGDDSVPTTVLIQRWTPKAKVVKAYNAVFWQILHAPQENARARGTVFIVGDDAEAKRIAAEVIADTGFDAVDAGAAVNAHHLEKLASFIIELGYAQGQGTNISYAIARI